jgi:hypothetical protein
MIYFKVKFILRPFGVFNGLLGTFCGQFGTFFQFWFAVPRKIWQPWVTVAQCILSLSGGVACIHIATNCDHNIDPLPMPTWVARWYISNQKSQVGYILEGLAMEDVGILPI